MYSGPYPSEFKINMRQHTTWKDEIKSVTVERKKSGESALPSFGKAKNNDF